MSAEPMTPYVCLVCGYCRSVPAGWAVGSNCPNHGPLGLAMVAFPVPKLQALLTTEPSQRQETP